MATSSFDKEFSIQSEKGLISLVNIINNPKKSKEINRSIKTHSRIKQGEETLKLIFS